MTLTNCTIIALLFFNIHYKQFQLYPAPTTATLLCCGNNKVAKSLSLSIASVDFVFQCQPQLQYSGLILHHFHLLPLRRA